jgi:hypothetical protein
VLTPAVSAEPGPWRNDRTPYLVGIMDSVCEPGVEETVFRGLYAGRGVRGHPERAGVGDRGRPRPVPVRDADRGEREGSVGGADQAPAECPAVPPPPRQQRPARHHAGGGEARFDGDLLRLVELPAVVGDPPVPAGEVRRGATSTRRSPAARRTRSAWGRSAPRRTGTAGTSSRSARRRRARVRSGGRGKACGDKRRYHVPCPHCGRFQVFAFPQVKWPKPGDGETVDKVKLADRIEQDRLAWYECANPDCKGVIRDHHKPKMLSPREVGQRGADDRRRRHGPRGAAPEQAGRVPPQRDLFPVAVVLRRGGAVHPGRRRPRRHDELPQLVAGRAVRAAGQQARAVGDPREGRTAARRWGSAGQVRVVPAWA